MCALQKPNGTLFKRQRVCTRSLLGLPALREQALALPRRESGGRAVLALRCAFFFSLAKPELTKTIVRTGGKYVQRLFATLQNIFSSVHTLQTRAEREGEKTLSPLPAPPFKLCVSGPCLVPALLVHHDQLGAAHSLLLLLLHLLLALRTQVFSGGSEEVEEKEASDRHRLCRQQQKCLLLPLPPRRRPLATPIRSAPRTSPTASPWLQTQ